MPYQPIDIPRLNAMSNPYLIGGQALGDLGSVLYDIDERNEKRKALIEQMTQQRADAIYKKNEEARREREQKIKDAEEARKAEAEKRAMDYRAKIAKGKVISPTLAAEPALGAPVARPSREELAALEPDALPEQRISGSDSTRMMGEALNRQPQPTGTTPFSREEMLSEALAAGQISPEDFATATSPLKTLEGQEQLIKAREEASEGDRAFRWAVNEFNQGRMDRRTLMQINAAMDRAKISERSKPKTESGMPMRGLEAGQADKISNAFQAASLVSEIQDAADNISSLVKGPIAGRASGQNPYDADIKALERLVNQTVPKLARGIFGEVGVLTDADVQRYKDMLITVNQDPGVAQRIMDDLKRTITNGYASILNSYDRAGYDVSRFERDIDFDALAMLGRTKGAKGSKEHPGKPIFDRVNSGQVKISDLSDADANALREYIRMKR